MLQVQLAFKCFLSYSWLGGSVTGWLDYLFQYLANYHTEILLYTIIFDQVGSKFLPNYKQTFKKLPIWLSLTF